MENCVQIVKDPRMRMWRRTLEDQKTLHILSSKILEILPIASYATIQPFIMIWQIYHCLVQSESEKDERDEEALRT